MCIYAHLGICAFAYAPVFLYNCDSGESARDGPAYHQLPFPPEEPLTREGHRGLVHLGRACWEVEGSCWFGKREKSGRTPNHPVVFWDF